MITDFLTPFIAVGLAELGDKTQLALILLASRTNKRFQLLLGAILGFFLVDGIAVLLGSWIAEAIPENLIKYGSAAIFMLFGILLLRGDGDEQSDKVKIKNPLTTSFILIAVTEFGDKTQIAAGLFATQYSPLLVFAGTMAALTLLSLAAVLLGQKISSKIDSKKTGKIAGLIFILIGATTLLI